MVVIADIDGYDLWLESHEWTAEEREEVRRFIEDRRNEGIDPEFSVKAAELLAWIRASAERPSSTVGTD